MTWITIDSALHIEILKLQYLENQSHVCIEQTDLQCISTKKLTGLLGKAI